MTRTYDFPNATIRVSRQECREFPKWCQSISVVRSRAYVAGALVQLRSFRRPKGQLTLV